MIRGIAGLVTMSSLVVPSIASAAGDAASAPAGGAAGIIAAVAAGCAGILTAAAALVAAYRSGRAAKSATERATAASEQADSAVTRATSAEQRAQIAAGWADRLANAHSDGVVLVLSYPGCVSSSRALLETNGWRVAHYPVTATELECGDLLPGGAALLADVASADAVVIEGLDEARMAQLAAIRPFRDRIRSGAGCALYTGGRNYRYDLTLWGECDQGVTTPVTTEGAVRASLARREATARRQGIRPGQLAAARDDLVRGQAVRS